MHDMVLVVELQRCIESGVSLLVVGLTVVEDTVCFAIQITTVQISDATPRLTQPNSGGDVLAQRGLGRSVQSPRSALLINARVAHRSHKERCASTYKVASRL